MSERGSRAAAAHRAGVWTQITLVASARAQRPQRSRAAQRRGLRDFGESYLQEALPKMAALRGAAAPRWHFIGALQANKTRAIAENFDWVHGVDRLRIAERLSEQRPFHAPPLKVCLQVNIAGEGSKGGVDRRSCRQLLRAVAPLPRLSCAD